MDNLALHPQTSVHIQRFTQRPSHALLLIGPSGSGKQSLAHGIMGDILQVSDVASYPYLKIVLPEKDKSAIGIEAVRELQHFASLKVPGHGAARTRRFILIPEAHNLTTEAQNALLKLLEEPPQDTHFILTANSSQALLPTIRSRTQQLTIHRPNRTDLEGIFSGQGHDTKAIQQAYLMSGGLPGLMSALLNDADHPLKTAAQTARQLLQSSQFERLCKIDELAKKRPEALNVLTILRHMSQAAIEQSAQAPGDLTTAHKRLKQWHKVLQASYDAEKAYSVSAQAKLTLTNLMLSL